MSNQSAIIFHAGHCVTYSIGNWSLPDTFFWNPSFSKYTLTRTLLSMWPPFSFDPIGLRTWRDQIKTILNSKRHEPYFSLLRRSCTMTGIPSFIIFTWSINGSIIPTECCSNSQHIRWIITANFILKYFKMWMLTFQMRMHKAHLHSSNAKALNCVTISNSCWLSNNRNRLLYYFIELFSYQQWPSQLSRSCL